MALGWKVQKSHGLDIIYDLPNYSKKKHDSIKSEGNPYNVAQRLRITDVNKDGLPDFVTFAGKGRYEHYTYINNGDMTFTEITANDKNSPIKRVKGYLLQVNDRFYLEDMN